MFLKVLVSVAILAICLPCLVQSDTECLVFEWRAEPASPNQGLYIKGLLENGKKLGNFSGLANATECFMKCCEDAETTGECNAASYYPDAAGVYQCYLLQCLPFSDCQWAETPGATSMAGFVYLTEATSEAAIEAAGKEVEDNLTWNIENPWSPGSTEETPVSTTVAAETTTQAATTQAEQATTQAPVKVTTQKNEDDQGEDEDDNDQGEDDDWPPTGGANAGMTAAGDQGVDTGDLVDGVGSTDEKISDSDDVMESHVNVPVVVVCTLGSLGLLAIVLVVVFKRMQAERDRSIYRPLMDDINSKQYRETDPLH